MPVRRVIVPCKGVLNGPESDNAIGWKGNRYSPGRKPWHQGGADWKEKIFIGRVTDQSHGPDHILWPEKIPTVKLRIYRPCEFVSQRWAPVSLPLRKIKWSALNWLLIVVEDSFCFPTVVMIITGTTKCQPERFTAAYPDNLLEQLHSNPQRYDLFQVNHKKYGFEQAIIVTIYWSGSLWSYVEKVDRTAERLFNKQRVEKESSSMLSNREVINPGDFTVSGYA